MNHYRTFVVVLACLCPVHAGSVFGQELDPFSSPTVVTPVAKAVEKPKLIVHTETLNECIKWMQMNYAVAFMNGEIDQMKRELETEGTPERKQLLENEIKQTRNQVQIISRELDNILLTTTIDYQRFLQFREQLKEMRMGLDAQLLEARAIARDEIRTLRAENETLRQKIRELEDKQ